MTIVTAEIARRRGAYTKAPAHRTRDAPRKTLKGDYIVIRRLVPGHDLCSPVSITRPLTTDFSAQSLHKTRGSLVEKNTHINANIHGVAIPNRSRITCAE